MQDVARNIRDLLLEFSGCWITPDFSIRGGVTQVSEQQREFRRIVSAATDPSMYNNAFFRRFIQIPEAELPTTDIGSTCSF